MTLLNRKLLFSTSGRPDYIPPPTLSHSQIICGPYYADMMFNNVISSIKTEFGEYDIEDVIQKLPKNQYPELFVCRTDSSRVNRPRNISSLNCPKVLVVGDTHHLEDPIISLLQYVIEEHFDIIIFDYTRQHAHFFVDAGFTNVYWLPGFNVAHIKDLKMKNSIVYELSFVGQISEFHHRRKRLIDRVLEEGLPIKYGMAEPSQARKIFSASGINLNCSLNGDLNLRIFEVISSGGFLLTDELGAESGLDIIFAPGSELATYQSIDDCIDKIHFYMNNKEIREEIATAGINKYYSTLSNDIVYNNFRNMLVGTANDGFSVYNDLRANINYNNSIALFLRIKIYQYIQSIHHASDVSSLLFSESVSTSVIADIYDLNRINMYVFKSVFENSNIDTILLRKIKSSKNINIIDDYADVEKVVFSALITTLSDWRSDKSNFHFFNNNPDAILLLADLDFLSADIFEHEFPCFRRVAEDEPLFKLK